MLPEWIHTLWLRIGALFRRRQLDCDLNDELEFHLAMRERKLVEQGVPPEEAHYAARRGFGNPMRAKETNREMWTFSFLETLLQDLRYGVRQLRRNPGFTAVAVITLALGIGANTAIFSVIDSLMLRTLPVPRPQQLVELWSTNSHVRVKRGLFSMPMFEELRRREKVFSNLSAWGGPVLAVEANNQTALGAVQTVTSNYFPMLGAAPQIGRFFGPGDARQAGSLNAPAVISYRFWQEHFGGNDDVLGKMIKVQGHPCTVIGVARPDFFGAFVGISADVWVPLGPPLNSPASLQNRKVRDYWVTARLREGVSIQQARVQVEAIWPAVLGATAPERMTPRQRSDFEAQRLRVLPAETGVLASSLVQFRRPLLILMVAVCLVLLVACVNLASLMLARASARKHELGVRLALGSSRARLARQILIESLMVSAAGALLAFPLALWTAGFLARFIWTGIVPLALDLHPDMRVFAFSVATAIATGLLVGLLPAWHAARRDPGTLLRGGGQGHNARVGRQVLANSLVTTQIAISLVLLSGAALFIHTVAKLQSVNPGFRTRDVIMMQLQPKPGGLKGFDAPHYWRELIDKVSALPGARSASLSLGSEPLLSPFAFAWKERVSMSSGASASLASIPATVAAVSPGFFHTIGINVLQGRDFNFNDGPKSPRVAVVSRRLAESLSPGGNPPDSNIVGREISVGNDPKSQHVRVIGIINDASLHDLRERHPAQVYFPMFQQSVPSLSAADLQVWTRGDPAAVANQIRRRINELGHEYPLWAHFMSRQVAKSIVRARLLAILSWFFGGLALLLAGIGLYGLLSYAVIQRTHEIGIRMALGARRENVLKLVVGHGFKLTLIGVAVGIAGALGLTRFLSSLLYGVKPTDPVTFIVVSLTLMVVALLACYIPARRAAKVDPMVALRHE